MRTRKKIFGAAAAIITVSALTACGGAAAPAPSAGEAADGSVDLRMTVWTANEDHLALLNGIADDYKSANPEIGKISFDSIPFADYETTLTTQIAGGNAPDLAWMGGISTDIMAAGGLAPLGSAFSEVEGYNYDDFLTSLTDPYTKDGELYAMPFSNGPYALFINTSLLEEAGLGDLDLTTLTWEKLDEVGTTVNKATGKAGFILGDFDYSNWGSLQPLWSSWGAKTWEGTQCTFTSDEMVDALTFFHNAVFTNGSHPGPGTTLDFFAGDAAFVINQISRGALLDGSFDYELMPLPAGPAGEVPVVAQATMGVLAGSKNVDQAVDFLAFLTNPDNSGKLSQFFPPARGSLLTGEKLAATNPTFTEEQLQRAVVEPIPNAIVPPVAPGMAEITATVKSSLDALWVADADIEAGLAATCEAISPLLTK
ncbi:ABC transporter substrate-binding protein [Microbacterium sp. A588]